LKICSDCKQQLNESQFSKSKNTKDGFCYICKECQKIRQQIWVIKTKSIIVDKKICSKCKEEKNLNQFHKHKHGKYGYTAVCKECRKKYINKEQIRLATKNYNINNKEKIKKYAKEYYKKNKEKRNKNSSKWYQDNKQYMNTCYKDKRNNNINRKIIDNIRRRVNYAIKHNQKKGHTLELLSCSIEFLKQHLSSKFTEGMTWENYGVGKNKWVIDHIIPCASFDLSLEENQQKCFNYTNLQPLWWFDNSRKKDKIDWKKNE
jgi:hypothetical protein